MDKLVYQWEVNPKATLSTFRTAWVASTVILILGVRLAESIYPKNNYLIWVFLTFFYLLVNSIFTFKYILYKKQCHLIFIQEGILHIPRLILWESKINIHEIRSLEKYSNQRSNLGILVGRIERGPVFVEKNLFNSRGEFEDFFRSLYDLALMSEKRLRQTDALAIRQMRLSHNPLIVISIAMVGMYLFSSDQGFEKIDDLILLEGGLNKTTIQSGEFYRIASSFFLHLSPWHLGLNILCFSIIGRYVLVILGTYRFVNIFFLSGIFGALASLEFSKYDVVVGASGGVLGLLGAYTYIWAKHNKKLPGSLFTTNWVLILALVMQLVFDLTEPSVDISNHIAGYVFGFFYGICVLKRDDIIKSAEPSSIEKIISTITILAFIYGLQRFLRLVF